MKYILWICICLVAFLTQAFALSCPPIYSKKVVNIEKADQAIVWELTSKECSKKSIGSFSGFEECKLTFNIKKDLKWSTKWNTIILQTKSWIHNSYPDHIINDQYILHYNNSKVLNGCSCGCDYSNLSEYLWIEIRLLKKNWLKYIFQFKAYFAKYVIQFYIIIASFYIIHFMLHNKGIYTANKKTYLKKILQKILFLFLCFLILMIVYLFLKSSLYN